MSIRAYRLLRNNKEEGPFTAEEIIQKSLKPFDLIWVDGRSAAWNYPGELAEFKKYVPDEPFSSKEIIKPVSSSVHAAIAMNNAIIQPEAKQQKPRYKVSAAWSKIQTTTAATYNEAIVAEPKNSYKKIVEAEQTTSEAKSLSWKEAWLDWEKEKVITPVAATKATVPPQTTPIKNYVEPVLETKYSEPLDAIKDRYIDNLLQQKQKSKKGFSLGKISEFVIPSVALIIIFSVGYWLFHNTNETASALNSAPAKTEQPAKVESTNPVPASTINSSATNNVERNNANSPQDVKNVSAPVLSNQAENRKMNFANTVKLNSSKENKSSSQTSAPDTKITVQKIENNTKQFDASVINNVPSNNVSNDPSNTNTSDLNAQDARPVKRRTDDVTNNPSTPKKESTPFKNLNTKSSANYVTVPEYAEMNNGSADLKIQNISDVNLDLVVVDVQYFDASSRFRKGETLYLHNLKAGKTVVVKTPKDLNSQYATSKISLVSSDANNVYVIGEN